MNFVQYRQSGKKPLFSRPWVRRVTLICGGVLVTFALTAALSYFDSQRKVKRQMEIMEAEPVLLVSTVLHIHKDRSIDVKEQVSVHSEQMRLKHGIKREVPKVFGDRTKKQYNVEYEVKLAAMDGKTFTVGAPEERGTYYYYRLGSKDTLLTKGKHVFDFHYHATNRVTVLKDREEIIMDVTGVWGAPVKKAKLVVYLPQYIDRQTVRYEGRIASVMTQEKDPPNSNSVKAEILPDPEALPQEERSILRFETQRELRPFERFMIRAYWPLGFSDPA